MVSLCLSKSKIEGLDQPKLPKAIRCTWPVLEVLRKASCNACLRSVWQLKAAQPQGQPQAVPQLRRYFTLLNMQQSHGNSLNTSVKRLAKCRKMA